MSQIAVNSAQRLLLVACLGFGCGGAELLESPHSDPSSNNFSATVIHINDVDGRSPPSNKARIRKLARGKNGFMGELWIDALASVPLHRDPTEEYLYVLSGGGTLNIADTEYVLKPGHGIYMPAKVAVSFKNGPVPTVLLQFFAGPESARKYLTWPKRSKHE